MTLLSKFLLILLVAFLNTHAPAQYTGPDPTVTTTPRQPHASQLVHVNVFGLPRDVSDVNVVVKSGTWPAQRRSFGEYVAAVPTGAAGWWQVTVRFREHGHTFTAPGGLVAVQPAAK